MSTDDVDETAIGDEIEETRECIREHADSTEYTNTVEHANSGETPSVSRSPDAKKDDSDQNMSDDIDNVSVSELERMDSMLADSMEQLYFKAAGDGRIRDEHREELRLKMLKAMSTLARTRLQVYEAKELENMRAELEALLSEAENDEAPIGQPTEIEHVIGGSGDER